MAGTPDATTTDEMDETLAGLDGCVVRSVDPDRVAATQERLVDPEAAGALAHLFRLLGDQARVRMLYALLEAGELCVCDLAAVTAVPESSVSHALRLLRTAGIVRNRRDGRMVYYRLADSHVRLLLDVSAEHLRHEHADER
jgi:DNA-binding transcriptional ArsR family regulator